MLKTIHQTSPSALARSLAGPLTELVSETFGGAFANAHADSAWLATAAYADLTSGSTFSAGDLVGGRTDVFVSLPLKVLQTTPAIARTIIGALLNACYEASGDMPEKLLFLLDEVHLLGHMAILATARDAGRKFGAVCQLIYQSVGQIDAQWGKDGRKSWVESTSWRSFSAIRDIETAEEISRACGEYGALGWTEGQNTGRQGRSLASSRTQGRTKSYHEMRRRLIRAEEILNMRDDEQIVLHGRGRPLRCGRPIYWRRPEMLAKTNRNPFVKESLDAR